MKLELKHIVGYLPYELNTNKGRLIGIRNWIGWCGEFKDTTGSINIPLSAIKPILRQLSDLTKEIDVNGEKFVPIVELCKLSFDYLDIEKTQIELDSANRAFSISLSSILSLSFDSNDNSFIAINKGKTVCAPNQLKLFEKLYEWHFDLHSLIEKELAIDINTLKP